MIKRKPIQIDRWAYNGPMSFVESERDQDACGINVAKVLGAIATAFPDYFLKSRATGTECLARAIDNGRIAPYQHIPFRQAPVSMVVLHNKHRLARRISHPVWQRVWNQKRAN